MRTYLMLDIKISSLSTIILYQSTGLLALKTYNHPSSLKSLFDSKNCIL